MNNKIFTINSRKYDGSIHRSWRCCLLVDRNPLYIFRGEFEKEVNHSQLGVIRRGTVSTEYFWLDRFYNVFRFETPVKDLIGYYCNLNLPPRISENVLDFVDLDVDIFVQKDFSYQILDEEDFIINSQKYEYPAEIIQQTANAVVELKHMIENRQFPFDTSS